MPRVARIIIDDAFIGEWHPKYDVTENDEQNYQKLVIEVARDIASLGTISQNTFLAVWKWKGAMRVIRHVSLDEYDSRYAEAFRRAMFELPERKLAALLAADVKLPGVDAPTASTILHFMHPQLMPIVDVRTVGVLFAAALLSTDRRDLARYEEFRQAIEGIRQRCRSWSLRQIDRALFAYHKQVLEKTIAQRTQSACSRTSEPARVLRNFSAARSILGTNHGRFASVFQNRIGHTFSATEIMKLMSTESNIRPGSILPNDHGEGNKGECPCVGTDRQIFERLGRGTYRVRNFRS